MLHCASVSRTACRPASVDPVPPAARPERLQEHLAVEVLADLQEVAGESLSSGDDCARAMQPACAGCGRSRSRRCPHAPPVTAMPRAASAGRRPSTKNRVGLSTAVVRMTTGAAGRHAAADREARRCRAAGTKSSARRRVRRAGRHLVRRPSRPCPGGVSSIDAGRLRRGARRDADDGDVLVVAERARSARRSRRRDSPTPIPAPIASSSNALSSPMRRPSTRRMPAVRSASRPLVEERRGTGVVRADRRIAAAGDDEIALRACRRDRARWPRAASRSGSPSRAARPRPPS